MNSQLPIQFMRPRKLGEIPRGIWVPRQKPRDLQSEKGRLGFLKRLRSPVGPDEQMARSVEPCHLVFNVAAWLRLPQGANGTLSLILHYADADGEAGILIDESNCSGKESAMLTGRVSLQTRGLPQFLDISLAGLDAEARLIVDDIFVERIDTPRQAVAPQRNSA